MQVQLPPAKAFRQFCCHENGWSDHYGALQVAAAYSGLVVPPRYVLRGIWQHGVFGPWQHFHPSILVYNAPGAAHRPVFVAREDEAELLRQHGFTQVRAIGMPILYVPDPTVPRQAGSLLVVPTHSLVGDKHQDRSAFERYADSIREVAGRFSRVVACIHPNCRRNGLWVKEFTERGIEIVYGAETRDAHALLRMRMLFAQFDTVTTNEWGSHVAYALAFGARVSIAGQPIAGDPALHARDEMWKNDPAAMQRAFSPEVAQARRKFLERLYVPPTDGISDPEFGRWFIGAGHQLPPSEMAAALKALITPEPQALAGAPVAGAAVGPRKRILFVCHEASRTGAPMFLLHFLRWLHAAGVAEFEILLGKTGPLEAEFAKVAPVHLRQDFESNPEALKSFDLIYSNTCCNSDLLEVIRADRVPVVTHFHELDLGYEWLGARRMAAVLDQSTRYIACAEAVASRIKQVFGVPDERISRHYEMIDAEAVRQMAAGSDPVALRRAHGIPENALVVAACGTVDYRKAPDLFVQMANHLKRSLGNERPLRFLWIGAQNVADLVRMINLDRRKLGLEAEFMLIGEQASPHGLLSLCDVFCLTSREDPFPLVMLEVAALGKPVVCFDGAGGAGEFCARGGGVAVPYMDTSAMAEACRRLLTDPEARAEMGRRGRTAVQAHYTVEAVAPALWAELHGFSGLVPTAGQRRSLAEIYSHWNPTEAPQPAYRRAHLARAAARENARQLIKAGQRKEAAQLLIRAVNADLATKDGWIICEGLVEIASEMSQVDPRQSDLLLAKAREIARSVGVSLERFGVVLPVAAAA